MKNPSKKSYISEYNHQCRKHSDAQKTNFHKTGFKFNSTRKFFTTLEFEHLLSRFLVDWSQSKENGGIC